LYSAIAAEVAAVPRLSDWCQVLTHAAQHIASLPHARILKTQRGSDLIDGPKQSVLANTQVRPVPRLRQLKKEGEQGRNAAGWWSVSRSSGFIDRLPPPRGTSERRRRRFPTPSRRTNARRWPGSDVDIDGRQVERAVECRRPLYVLGEEPDCRLSDYCCHA
jgi:hypothetical protein